MKAILYVVLVLAAVSIITAAIHAIAPYIGIAVVLGLIVYVFVHNTNDTSE